MVIWRLILWLWFKTLKIEAQSITRRRPSPMQDQQLSSIQCWYYNYGMQKKFGRNYYSYDIGFKKAIAENRGLHVTMSGLIAQVDNRGHSIKFFLFAGDCKWLIECK